MLISKKKRLEYLRSIWGKSIEKHRNFDFISYYHDLIDKEPKEQFIDNKTWDDLNFNSIFAQIDRNITGIGQQYLYHLLHKYEDDENVLKKRFTLIELFKNNQSFRESIQIDLLNIKGHSAYFISYLLTNKSLPNTKYFRLFYLCSFFSILSVLLISINGLFLFLTLGILLLNIVLNRIFANKIYEYFTGFSALNSLINTALLISNTKTNIAVSEIEFLKEKSILLKQLKKKLGYFVIDKDSLNELVLVVIEYLNMFMLFDIIAYFRSVNILLKYQNELLKVYRSVAILDTSIAISSYLVELKKYSNPIFNTDGKITFKELYHPLIVNAVPNSVDDIGNSVLITGSNMSGKTTFIKTIGINFILAQTLYFCYAKFLNIPKYYIKTSIKRNDDLENKKSYFFSELEQIKLFIELAQAQEKYLFLIDEIFRGTNTVERLASSTAVLDYLNKTNRVFVTTHDIELQNLLDRQFKIYHFSEHFDNNTIFFNYKIKEGPCSSGNAIKLLEVMEYPESIIKNSNKLVQEFISNQSRHNE